MSELSDYLKLHGAGETKALVELVQKVMWSDLRDEFIRVMTVNSKVIGRHHRDYNQAIFDAEEGWAVFTNTDLGMILAKFDQAVRNTKGQK